MSNANLQKLVDKAGEMAMHNIWGEKAHKINVAILKLDRNNCAACTRLAKYYKLNDNIAEAKNMYLKALDIEPENRGALNNLNDFERDQNENEYVDKIKTIGELFKDGHKCLLKGKFKLAEKLFSKAYSIEPSLTYAASLATVYKKTGKFDDIEKLYTQLIEENQIPEDVEAINSEFKLLRMNTKIVFE
ncbi:MAG TPA: hypothetical protein VIK78_13130 [Ruminiclostridium sp.]